MQQPVVDAHVHFWDPSELEYPWLEALPSLRRAFLPRDYAAATGDVHGTVVFVEANCRPEDARREVRFVERLAQRAGGPRIGGIIAYADLTDRETLNQALDALAGSPLVKGVRHNIQGQPAGFALQPAFVAGVREVGHRGLTFDLCVTHDQLDEVGDLVGRCPDTHFVLDHGAKPPIRARRLEPWQEGLARLGAHEHVCCKLSGLLTEAGPGGRGDAQLLPYAAAVVACFGTERVMYGSDWPVLTLAGRYRDWYDFTARFTAEWTAAERNDFYAENAVRVYGL
jgi:L-fuconolactonase